MFDIKNIFLNCFVQLPPLLCLLIVLPLQGQIPGRLDVGNTLYFTDEMMLSDKIYWPRTWCDNSAIGNFNEIMLNHLGIIIGQKLDWEDPQWGHQSAQIAMFFKYKYENPEEVTVPVQNTFKRIYRFAKPQILADGQDLSDLIHPADSIDSNLPADEVVYAKVLTWPNYNGGLQLERWIYGFVNDEYDDIVFNEYVLKNVSDEMREGIYLALLAQTTCYDTYCASTMDKEIGSKSLQTFYKPYCCFTTPLWGNYYGVNYWKFIKGDEQADSLRMWYSWSADYLFTPEDEKGFPDIVWGHLLMPHYYTLSVVHADKSASDESDDPRQPYKAGWLELDKLPSLDSADHDSIYKFLSLPWKITTDYSLLVDSSYSTKLPGQTGGMYRVLIPGFNENEWDSNIEKSKTCLLSFGPYTLQPGEDVRFVIALTGGTIPLRLAIDAGRAYDSGLEYRQETGIVPMPYDVYDLHGNKIINEGDILTKEQKDALINSISKELAFKNAGKALRLWKKGNVKKTRGSFNIPMAPPSPSVEYYSGAYHVKLKWHPVENAIKYRVYKEYKKEDKNSPPTDTTFVMVKELTADSLQYIDRDVVLNELYYYYITAINSEGVESSHWLNRAETGATIFPHIPWTGFPYNTVVVPNPYHISGAHNYKDNILVFFNVPPYARVLIYTMTGDLVNILYNEENNGALVWKNPAAGNGKDLVSGIYIFVVEELDGPDGRPTGAKAIGKFVVIK